MPYIFADEFQRNLVIKKEKVNIIEVKNIIKNLCIVNNINYVPIKVIYLIIYLLKNKYKFKLIKIIEKKVLKRAYIRLSRFFLNRITKVKWLDIIEIAKINDVENDLFNYFFELYEYYLKIENNENIYKYQLKSIFDLRIGYYRQFKKYIKSNIYTTYFLIDIICSRINKLNIKKENIYININ